MTANEKRQTVLNQYDRIIGRNIYSQSLRDYCYRKYKDGNYYSDCSSSICYAYQEAGYGFGIMNTAGIYQSSRLTTMEVPISSGIPEEPGLRKADMLEYAGTDAGRPLRIGHVEMYCGNGIICGHGSGRPSYKNLEAYCRSRYGSWAPGGWRKGLVCVRRYIQDDAVMEPEEPKLSGWKQEADGTRSYYLGNTGEPVRNAWYLDADGRWYWFDGAGHMVRDTWYLYKGDWYYLGTDGAMARGRMAVDGKWYILDADGKLVMEPVILTPDQDGALQYTGLAD